MENLENWNKPSIILINGNVITVDPKNMIAGAVAVAHGRIVAIGSSEQILRMRGPNTAIYDLKGRTVLPGLTDPHVHLADDGTRTLATTDIRDFHTNVRTIEHLLEQIRIQAGLVGPGKWIVGFGSPMQDFRMPGKRYPNRQELDGVAPHNPVLLTFGAHITVANSLALDTVGIDATTPDPKGGHIEHDAQTGELTGRLFERAQIPAKRHIPKDIPFGASSGTPALTMKEGILKAGKAVLARGVTTVHDIVASSETIVAYHELAAEGRLPVRTSMLIRIIESTIKPESLLNVGIGTGFGNDWLKIGGVKMSIDGGITGRAAAFSQPYVNDACNCGLIRIPADELDHTVDMYHRAGHRCCVHAIGDVGMDMAVTAFDKAITRNPRPGHRHRVEHLGNWMMTPERIRKVVDLELIPVPNVTFMHYIYESVLDCVGPERLDRAFGLKSMLKAGIPITSGSDGPGYWPVDPLRDIDTACTRKTRDGNIVEPEEALSTMEALRLFTINAAYAGFEEGIKGSIEVGKLADFAVLGRGADLDRPDQPHRQVDMTIIGGKVVYENGAEDFLRI